MPCNLLVKIIICRLGVPESRVISADISAGIMILSAYGTRESQALEKSRDRLLAWETNSSNRRSLSNRSKLRLKLTVAQSEFLGSLIFSLPNFSNEWSVHTSQGLLLCPLTSSFHSSIFPKLSHLPFWMWVCQYFLQLPLMFLLKVPYYYPCLQHPSKGKRKMVCSFLTWVDSDDWLICMLWKTESNSAASSEFWKPEYIFCLNFQLCDWPHALCEKLEASGHQLVALNYYQNFCFISFLFMSYHTGAWWKGV